MPGTRPPFEWLLQGPAWVEYRTRLDLMAESEDSPQVANARARMLTEGPLQALVAELGNWPGTVIASHKSAGQPFHKLTFLADLGLKTSDPGMAPIINRVLSHQDSAGPFQLHMNISEAYGGTGQETWGWALCDAPLVLYALASFGLAADPRVRRGIDHLTGLVRANGWPCAVSSELGSWRGPGRKDDPCPFANLAMLKLLSVSEELRATPAARSGIKALLSLWQNSQTQHPYIFYMGNDFRKLKVPFIWYDLVHVLEVLSRFPSPRSDTRFRDMLAVLTAKMNPDGCFSLESVWQAWKEWEFGQKKTPSRWLTLCAWRILHRLEN
jgi:hypothetical protein